MVKFNLQNMMLNISHTSANPVSIVYIDNCANQITGSVSLLPKEL